MFSIDAAVCLTSADGKGGGGGGRLNGDGRKLKIKVNRTPSWAVVLAVVVVVSVLAFYSDNPSLNPADVYKFYVKLELRRTKANKKRPALPPPPKKIVKTSSKSINFGHLRTRLTEFWTISTDFRQFGPKNDNFVYFRPNF